MIKLSRKNVVHMVNGLLSEMMLALETASGSARQSYHGLKHCTDVFKVARRAAKILCDESYHSRDWEELIQILTVMAFGHDIIQVFDPEGMFDTRFTHVKKRKRSRGPNEDLTAEQVIKAIEMFDEENLISQLERAAVRQGIRFTFPEWNQAAGTMYQPRVFEALDTGKADPLAVSLAMGDLLCCGTFPIEFIRASDTLLVEECQGLNEWMLSGITSLEQIPENVQEDHLLFFKDWDANQAKFAEGQKKLTFQKILDSYPKKAEALLKAFDGFEESAIRSAERMRERKNWTFEQYARAVGFPVPI